MKPRVYVETTIISYLTASPSRDLVLAAHQQVTRDWWSARDTFELYVSQFVVDEVSAGETDAAERRIAAVQDLVLLELTGDATTLAVALIGRGGLPTKARIDALHIALAAVHGMDYLLSWNCAHIANARMRGPIEGICREAGFEPPIICTPIELVKEQTP